MSVTSFCVLYVEQLQIAGLTNKVTEILVWKSQVDTLKDGTEIEFRSCISDRGCMFGNVVVIASCMC